jgi:hypothetical protein
MNDGPHERAIFAHEGSIGYRSRSQHHAALVQWFRGRACGRNPKHGLIAACGSQRSVFAASACSHNFSSIATRLFVDRYFEHVVNTTAFIAAPLSPGLTTQGIARKLLSGRMSDIYTVDSVDDALGDVGRMVADTFDSLRHR